MFDHFLNNFRGVKELLDSAAYTESSTVGGNPKYFIAEYIAVDGLRDCVYLVRVLYIEHLQFVKWIWILECLLDDLFILYYYSYEYHLYSSHNARLQKMMHKKSTATSTSTCASTSKSTTTSTSRCVYRFGFNTSTRTCRGRVLCKIVFFVGGGLLWLCSNVRTCTCSECIQDSYRGKAYTGHSLLKLYYR
jgi:hypothetical protein